MNEDRPALYPVTQSNDKVFYQEFDEVHYTIAVEIGWGSIERLLGLLWREAEGRTYNSRYEVTVHRQAFSELKMPYDTVVAADFADLECEASAKSVTGTRYEWTVTIWKLRMKIRIKKSVFWKNYVVKYIYKKSVNRSL